MNFLNILLQAPATGGSQWSGIIMMVVIVAIFYFFYMMIEVANGVSIRVDKASVYASIEDAKQK